MTSLPRMTPRSVAASATALIAVAVVLWLVLSKLHFTPPADRVWPPEPDSEILLADEYVEVMEIPVTVGGNNADAPEGALPSPADGMALADAGVPGEVPSQPATQTLPSPAQQNVTPTDRRQGPAKSEIPQANTAEQRRADARAAAGELLQFNTTGGSGVSTQGTGQSNSPTNGTHRGRVGKGNLNGRKLSVPAVQQKSSRPGKVVVRIFVNREGIQTSQPRIISNTTGDSSVEADCLRIARAATVSPSADAPAEQYADITVTYQ